MENNYNSKINELVELKEKNKIIRQLRQSKERLLHDNPQAIVPFLKDKYQKNIFREPRKNFIPIIESKPPISISPVFNRDKEYFEMMKIQQQSFVNELHNMRNNENKSIEILKEQFEQSLRNQDEKTSKSLEEIRNHFQFLTQNQIDLLTYGKGQQPAIVELKNLKNQYILDGGNDAYILRDIEKLIEEAEKPQREKSLNSSDWKETRRNMALAYEKSNELRDLERQNSELEKQIQIDRIRTKNIFKGDNKPKQEEKEKHNFDKIENLQQQIQILSQEINNLKQPTITERSEMLLQESSSIPKVSPIKLPDNNKEADDFIIILDSISGVGQQIISAIINLEFYCDNNEIMEPIECKAKSVRPLKKTDLDSSIIINVKKPIFKCPKSKYSYALLKLKVKTSSYNDYKLESWTQIKFFNESGLLKTGKWDQSLFILPVKTNIILDNMLSLPQYHRAKLQYEITKTMETDNDIISIISNDIQTEKTSETKGHPFLVNMDINKSELDDDNEKSDITVDLDEKPDCGFQIIRVKNFAIGNVLDLAKLRLTVYHTEGPRKDQIVMSSNGPVTCSSISVRSDFKIACYQFGKQIGRFSNLDLSIDCVLFALFYLEKYDENVETVQKENFNKDDILIGWTALPLLKRRKVAKINPSYYTDNLKILKINKGIHDLPFYEPPTVSPTSIVFDRNGFITGQKPIGKAKLKLRIFHTIPVYDTVTSSDEISDYSNEEVASLYQKPWIEVKRLTPILIPYHQDDGFDLYIDSGHMLPDSVTIVKIEGQIVNRNLTNQNQIFSCVNSLNSDIFNPRFDERIEFRQPSLTPSSTILLKIFTFDRENKSLVILGYSALNVFVETGTDRQPAYDNLGVFISLNDGGHQLRIYTTSPNENTFPFTESWFEANRIKSIPGASVLIRLFKSKKDSSEKLINIQEVSENQREKLGVLIPSPKYSDGYYYSMKCKPTTDEISILNDHIRRPNLILRDLISSKWSDKLKETVPFDLLFDIDMLKLFNKFTPVSFNMNHISSYNPSQGFKIAIDGCMNIPWRGYTMAHICIFPPGALYMEKPFMVYDRPFLVSQLDLDSTPSSPIWKNGWKLYKRRKFDENLIVIIHLHELVLKNVKSDFVFSLENEAWIPLQIFDDSYCITNAFQMPLINGGPKLSDLQELKTMSVAQFLKTNLEKKPLVPHASVIIRQCDGRRTLEMSLSSSDNLLILDQSYIPEANLSKYRSIFKSSSELNFSKTIPPSLNSESFQKLLSLKFKKLIYKFYDENGFQINEVK